MARDLDEVRQWVTQGRLLREDLIWHAGGPEVRADRHPLTRHFFEMLDAEEAAPTGAPVMEVASPGAAEGAAGPAPGTPAGEALGTAGEAAVDFTEDGTAVPTEAALAEAAGLAEAEGEPGRLPGGLRAIGVLDFLLSFLFPPILVGLAAAIGLLRGRAWGRALTLFWATTTLLAITLGGIRYAQAPIPVDALRRMAPGLPVEEILLSGAVFGAALAVYLLVVLVTLARRSAAARFHGGGSLTAILLALIFYVALGGLVVTGALKDQIARLRPLPVAPSTPPKPRVRASLPAPGPLPPTEVTEGRAFTADGLASVEVVAGWKVRKITEGEPANLGVMLEGERSVPTGTMRLITADPGDLERQDERFDRVDTKRGDIKEVEVVRRGEFEGRKVVTAFPVNGGLTGNLLLSLHDRDQAYQFRCGARGPFFEAIRPECERMAASLLVSNRSAAPAAPTTVQPAAPAGSALSVTTPDSAAAPGSPAPSRPRAGESTPLESSPPAPATVPPGVSAPASP